MWHHSLAIVVSFAITGCTAAQKPAPAGDQTPRTADVVTDVDRIGPFRTVRPTDDGVYLASAEPTGGGSLALSINGQPWTDHGEARVGNVVHIGIPDAFGAGACWYEVLEVTQDAVVFRENTWFYDITPETHEVVRVRPYGDAR